MPNFKPILFSTEMVQAILENRKTQTRSVVKGEPLKWLQPEMFTSDFVANAENALCPYGIVGDVLWVREKFIKKEENYFHFATVAPIWQKEWKWKPSIHMPKEACWIFLKIKSIKVERLWDISEEDAKREGVVRSFNANEPEVELFKFYPHAEFKDESFVTVASVSFFSLWESINGRKSWESNPWVWVIEFERIDKPENFE